MTRKILINRRVTRVSVLLITSHLRSRSQKRDAFVLKTNLSCDEAHRAESRLEACAERANLRGCSCFCDKWVSGTVAIPDRSGRIRRITLSKPVIPDGEFELNASTQCDA